MSLRLKQSTQSVNTLIFPISAHRSGSKRKQYFTKKRPMTFLLLHKNFCLQVFWLIGISCKAIETLPSEGAEGAGALCEPRLQFSGKTSSAPGRARWRARWSTAKSGWEVTPVCFTITGPKCPLKHFAFPSPSHSCLLSCPDQIISISWPQLLGPSVTLSSPLSLSSSLSFFLLWRREMNIYVNESLTYIGWPWGVRDNTQE